jgi:hypothetical protein
MEVVIWEVWRNRWALEGMKASWQLVDVVKKS